MTMLDPNGRHRAHLADYLPPASWFLLVEPGDLEDEGRRYLERLERPEEVHHVSDALRQVLRFPVGRGVGGGRRLARRRPAG